MTSVSFGVAILMLGVLIFVHELGHFLFAKWNNVGVIEFAIGFGKKLWSRKIGETTYSLRLIPLGGYVRMVGDDIRQVTAELSEEEFALLDEDEELDAETKKLLEDKERWFLAKGFFAKSAIVIAGPGFNVLFAFILAVTAFWIYGLPVHDPRPVIGRVIPKFPAEKAGIKPGDLVKSIDGKKMSSWEDIATTISASKGAEMKFDIERSVEGGGSESLEILVAGTSDTEAITILEGSSDRKRFMVGITHSETREPIGFSDAIGYGYKHCAYVSVMILRGLGAMVMGLISPENISGPIGIVKAAADQANEGFESLILFTVFLSLSLAILNLLPIPILDGGHLVFFIVEAVKGNPVSLRVHELANQVGLAILLLLMIFAIWNDIWQHVL